MDKKVDHVQLGCKSSMKYSAAKQNLRTLKSGR